MKTILHYTFIYVDMHISPKIWMSKTYSRSFVSVSSPVCFAALLFRYTSRTSHLLQLKCRNQRNQKGWLYWEINVLLYIFGNKTREQYPDKWFCLRTLDLFIFPCFWLEFTKLSVIFGELLNFLLKKKKKPRCDAKSSVQHSFVSLNSNCEFTKILKFECQPWCTTSLHVTFAFCSL